jgi:hypothetical protein
MLTIQEAHAYVNLCNSGLASHIKCKDENHPSLVTGTDISDQVTFSCLACSYILYPGDKTVNKIKLLIYGSKN